MEFCSDGHLESALFSLVLLALQKPKRRQQTHRRGKGVYRARWRAAGRPPPCGQRSATVLSAAAEKSLGPLAGLCFVQLHVLPAVQLATVVPFDDSSPRFAPFGVVHKRAVGVCNVDGPGDGRMAGGRAD